MKRVIALVGMIGAGKTVTISALKKRGHDTLKVDYMKIARKFPCDNRLILSKWAWISNWFYNVEKYFLDNPQATNLFVDRSVLEVGIWTDNCKPLLSPLMVSMEEFKLRGYEVTNICLKCEDFNIIQERIKGRLISEPERLNFNEGNPRFLRDLFDLYVQNETLWDIVLDTQDITTDEICNRILRFLNLHENV